MTTDWVKDIENMHNKFEVKEKVEQFDASKRRAFLEFRYNFLKEEMEELQKSVFYEDSEEIVDALIDICVVAIGTLDLFGIDAHKAWDEVHRANMEKKVGVKSSRPNPLGLPDLVKPDDWKAPSHKGNTGRLNTTQEY